MWRFQRLFSFFRNGSSCKNGFIRLSFMASFFRQSKGRAGQMLDGKPHYWGAAISALGFGVSASRQDYTMCCQPASPDPVLLNRAGIANYELGDVLGRGMFSEVREATHILTGTKVAIKIISNIATDGATITQEIRAMKLVKGHPHVVTLFEVGARA